MNDHTYNHILMFSYPNLVTYKYYMFSFRNYVVQYLLELGDTNVTVLLLKQLLGNYAFLARNKFASHVVQKFLKIEYIDPSFIVYDLLKDIDTLLLDPFGNYVIQTAWFVCKVMNIKTYFD